MERGNSIGARIEQLRKEKGLTQAELGKELGVKRETVNQWESNTRDLKTQRIIDLAQFFGVTADYLLGLSPYARRENEEITARELGLSEKAVQEIKWETERRGGLEDYVGPLNRLITSRHFSSLLGQMERYLLVMNTIKKASGLENEVSYVIRDLDRFFRRLRFEMGETWSDLLEELAPPPPFQQWITQARERERNDNSAAKDYFKRKEQQWKERKEIERLLREKREGSEHG